VRHAGSLKSCRDREHAQQPRAASGFQSAPTPEQRTVHDPEFGDVDPSLILRGRGRTPERGPLSARWPDRRMPGGQCQGRSTKMGECGLLQVWSMNAIASLEHECENGSGSYSANAGGHFGRRMYPSCRPVRLSPGATSAHPVRSRRGSARRSAELWGAGLIVRRDNREWVWRLTPLNAFASLNGLSAIGNVPLCGACSLAYRVAELIAGDID
jgi:hypothetical protein